MLITREVMTIASPAHDMFFFLQMMPLLSVASARDVLMTPPQLQSSSPWRNQSKKPYGCVVSSTASASRTSFRHEFSQTIKGRSGYQERIQNIISEPNISKPNTISFRESMTNNISKSYTSTPSNIKLTCLSNPFLVNLFNTSGHSKAPILLRLERVGDYVRTFSQISNRK